MSQRHAAVRTEPSTVLFGRFEVLEELGSGGFGRVLRCTDIESGEVVAFKELHRFGADALLRFKKEFRLLADVQHPNLVRLGELFEGDGQWGFSLEYVHGSDALTWLQGSYQDSGVNHDKIRLLLTELVHGLSAIHAIGVLHRDVKPANIRVTPDGRVVLLDFGVATHLLDDKQTSEAVTVGTVAYMAPEQASAERLTPAADWYSLGVLLYEALTGRLPFEGAPMHVLLSKHRGDVVPPSQLGRFVPADLETICMGLLTPRPEGRLDGAQVLNMLGQPLPTSVRISHASREEPFVGRAAELRELRACFERALEEGIGTVLIEGESGIGKSSVARSFARTLVAQRPELLLLSGRCHAAEQVGYKAFDGVVDELSRYLKALPTSDCRALLPEDAHLLPVLFPVLERVPALSKARRQARVTKVERYPLFQAFFELLRRLGRERPLLLLIDDLQWADEASLVLLRMLLDSQRLPRLFLVATVRPLETLDDIIGHGLRALAAHGRVTRIGLGPLSEADTRTLIGRLMPEPNEKMVERLLGEAHGHPLFVNELVRHTPKWTASPDRSGLDAAIAARVDALDAPARMVLELSAIAGAPLPHAVLRSAAGYESEPLREALATLRIQKLLHTVRRNETLVYHDRIREAVLRALPAAVVQAHHRRLAEAFMGQAASEPARVALHWLGCGETQRALPQLARAAERAEQGGVFEQAAEHYRTLLGLKNVAHERAQVHALRLALSDALASAGRCAESARVLLSALEDATEQEALELTIRAAQRLLQAAEIKEGLAAAEKAFALLRLPWPKSTAQLLMRILWHRAWIALRGLEVRRAEPGATSEQHKTQLEALWRLAWPVSWADIFRSVEISSRHTRLALACRDAEHASLALCGQAALHTMQGTARAQVLKIFDQARAWREGAAAPELEAFEMMNRGMSACFWVEARDAEEHLERAEHLYSTACRGAAWELTNVRGSLLTTWHLRGRIKHHAERAQAWLDEADARGDLFARTMYLATGQGCLRHLLADAPARALSELDDAIAPWRVENAGAHEVMGAAVGALLMTYPGAGDVDAFWAARWPRLEKTVFLRMPVLRELIHTTRCGSLLRTAFEGDEHAARCVRELAERLPQGRSPWAQDFGIFTRAQVAWLDQDRELAAKRARQAVALLERNGYELFLRSALVLMARAEKSADAGDHEQRLLEWLAGEGFVRPDKALLWLLPSANSWR